MIQKQELIGDEQGSVFIVVAVLVLALLTIYGMSITRTVVTESRIATNQHLHRMAFYQAEGGTQLAMELIRDNIYHRGRQAGEVVQGITIDQGNFYMNATITSRERPDLSNRVAHYPNPDTSPPFTRLMVGGLTSLSSGSAIHMLNGYSGPGKAAAKSGACVVFNIRSQYLGRRSNESIVDLFYRYRL